MACARSLAAALVGALVGLAIACVMRGVFVCTDDAGCDRFAGGLCEETGYCSYPDPACPSQRAYDDLAAESLRGECVDGSSSGTGSESDGEGSISASTDASTGAGDTELPDGPPRTPCEIVDCLDEDGDGFGIGSECAGADCDDGNPDRIADCLYLAPDGDDGSDGSRDAPWRTFAHAIAQLQPDDTLVLLDGEYDEDGTGLLFVDCSAGGNAVSGAGPEAPISVRAENERAAVLVSRNATAVLEMIGCGDWRVSGLAGHWDPPADSTATGVDLVALREIQGVVVRRFALHGGGDVVGLANMLHVTDATDVVVEECELIDFANTGIRVDRTTSSERVRVRRCYVNSPFSIESVFMEAGADHRVENCIVEHGATNGSAYRLHGTGSTTLQGSIALASYRGLFMSDYGGPDLSAGHRIRDFVALHSRTHGIYLRNVKSVELDAVSILSSDNRGLYLEDHDPSPCTRELNCGFTARHVLALDNGSHGISVVAPTWIWTVTDSNSYGNGTVEYEPDEDVTDDVGSFQRSSSVPVAGVGLGPGECPILVPPRLTAPDGLPIGANVVFRVVDGVVTDEPLWDPVTGRFPCGAIAPGINDGLESCEDVHERLNVDGVGQPQPDCPLSYGPDSCP